MRCRLELKEEITKFTREERFKYAALAAMYVAPMRMLNKSSELTLKIDDVSDAPDAPRHNIPINSFSHL